jgi:hypothetical protein
LVSVCSPERAFFLSESRDRGAARLRDLPVCSRSIGLVNEWAEIDGSAKYDVNWISVSSQPSDHLANEVIAQAIHKDGNHGHASLAHETADASLCREQGVRIAAQVPRAFGVDADKEASTPKQRSHLVEASEVESGSTLVPKYRRIHRKEAHRAVDEQTHRIVEEEARTNGK